MIGLLPLAGIVVVIAGTSLLLARCLVMARRDTYPPEAAEAPDPVAQGYATHGPCRADRAQMALRFRLLVDESLSDLRSVDADLAPLYGVPEEKQ